MKNKSLLFQTISEEEINTISNKYFLSDVERYKIINGGMFNTTYCIQLKTTKKKYILRIGPVRQDVLLPFEQHLAEAELYVCELLKKENIPTNRPTASDFSRTVLNRDYIVFEYIDGTVLSSKCIKRKNLPHLYTQAGEMTKKVHQIKGEYFGRIADSFRGVTFSTWADFILNEIQELKYACIENKVFTPNCFSKIEFLFDNGKPYFDTVKTPYLVHADLWAGNIMIDRNQTHIAAIIDTDRCLFGDPDIDLSSPWMINKHFLCGYGEIKISNNQEIKLLFYQLLYAIIDAYVWKVEYRNHVNYKKSHNQTVKLLKAITRLL
ncbi:MAG: phosphotransferase [Candidatus Fimenecus sp.]